MLFGGALLSGAGGVFGAFLVIIGVVFAAGLFAAQVLLTVVLAVLIVAGPPLIALSAIPELSHLSRSWAHALLAVALVPLGWTVLFATAGALCLDATSFTGAGGGLPGHVAAAFAGLITFVIAARLPLMAVGEVRHLFSSQRAPGRGASQGQSTMPGSERVRAAHARLRAVGLEGVPSLGRSAGRAAGAIGAPQRGPAGAARRGLAAAARRTGILAAWRGSRRRQRAASGGGGSRGVPGAAGGAVRGLGSHKLGASWRARLARRWRQSVPARAGRRAVKLARRAPGRNELRAPPRAQPARAQPPRRNASRAAGRRARGARPRRRPRAASARAGVAHRDRQRAGRRRGLGHLPFLTGTQRSGAASAPQASERTCKGDATPTPPARDAPCGEARASSSRRRRHGTHRSPRHPQKPPRGRPRARGAALQAPRSAPPAPGAEQGPAGAAAPGASRDRGAGRDPPHLPVTR